MIYNWYFVIDLADFLASGLVSRSFDLIFPQIGKKTLLLTYGNMASILVDGVFLPIYMSDKNPFEFGGYAVYYDSEGGVWLGIDAS